MLIDMTFGRARAMLVRQAQAVDFFLVGAGGTGSWVAPQIFRLARALNDAGRTTQVIIIDHDRVEEGNVGRSNFANAEIGRYKAQTLAARYGAAWGVRAGFVVERFTSEVIKEASGTVNSLKVIVGCVDNAAARRALAAATKARHDNSFGIYEDGCRVHSIIYIDCGNFTDEGGQVLIGTASEPEHLRGCLPNRSFCNALPAPGWQHPELLEDREEELTDNNLSCAEMMRRNAQSLMVNHFVASICGDYLMRLLLTHNLKRFATYFDLATCASRSLFITAEQLERTTGCDRALFELVTEREAPSS